jgi:hypothetical protein
VRWRHATAADEHVGDDKLDEQRCDAVQACLQLTAGGQDRGQRDALAHQGSGGVEERAADADDTISVDHEIAEADRLGEHLGCELAGE